MKRKFQFNINKILNYCNNLSRPMHSFFVYSASTINNPLDNTIIFTKKWDLMIEEQLSTVNESLIIIPKESIIRNKSILTKNYILFSENPRLEYAYLLTFILKTNKNFRKYHNVDHNVTIGDNVILGKDTIIEPYVFIDHNVIIGDKCIIKSGSRIMKNVIIGNDVVICDNSVIGGQGFGVERDGEKTIRIPHIGGVIIGNNVEVGALNTIASGTIYPTIIEDYVKTSDQVHIAHNCKIKKSTLIAGCVNISGSTVIGEKSWIGPNSTIRNKLYIGNNSFIGMGAVVVKNVDDGFTVIGNPAKPINKAK